MASEGRRSVDITTLGLQELEQIRDGLNEDIERIQVGLNSLKQATHGYILSKDAANSVRPENEGTDILVPMTSSISFSLPPLTFSLPLRFSP